MYLMAVDINTRSFILLNIFESLIFTYIHHSRFIPEGVAEVSQIFLRDTHVLSKLLRNTADVTGGKPIAV
jgi:hypothetical protein